MNKVSKNSKVRKNYQVLIFADFFITSDGFKRADRAGPKKIYAILGPPCVNQKYVFFICI